jgi:hypothetical protein
MTTWIIQSKNTLNVWDNFTDDENMNVEFVTKGGANKVAKELASSEVAWTHYSKIENWRLLDSHGTAHPVK